MPVAVHKKINRQPAYFCFRRHSPRETTNEHSSLVWRYTSCKLGSFPSRGRTTASAVDVSLPRRWDSLDVMASLSRRRTSSLGDCIYRIKMQIPAVRQMDRPVVLRTLGPRSTSSSFPVNQTSIADCKKILRNSISEPTDQNHGLCTVYIYIYIYIHIYSIYIYMFHGFAQSRKPLTARLGLYPRRFKGHNKVLYMLLMVLIEFKESENMGLRP